MLMHKLIRIHNLFLLALSFAIDQIAHILSVKQKVWQARLVLRLWNGKVLETYQIAAFISRDFFPKCHFGCISEAFRTLFQTLSEMHPKCIRNVS